MGWNNYVPAGQSEAERKQIGESFKKYCKIMTDVGKKYNAVPHWAKVEIPVTKDGNVDEPELKDVRERIQQRYNAKKFNQYRHTLDPNSVLSNELIDKIFST